LIVDAVVEVDVCDKLEYGGGAVLDFEFERTTISPLMVFYAIGWEAS